MDYLTEFKAFYKWCQFNPLPADAQALWYALVFMGGIDTEFEIDNQKIISHLHISPAQFFRIRDLLLTKKLIIYQKKRGRSAGVCKVNRLVSHNENQPERQIERQPERQNKKSSHNERQPNPFVTEIIRYYHSKFVEKFNEKPTIDGGKDGRLIKGLLGTYGPEKLKGLIDKFFDSDDIFITKSGYTIGVLKTQVNKLIINKDQNQESNGLGAVIRAAKKRGIV